MADKPQGTKASGAAVDYSTFQASDDDIARFIEIPFDHQGARAALLSRIERTVKQLNGDRVAPRGGKDFVTLNNNGVIYSPTIRGQAFVLPGAPEGRITTSRERLMALLEQFSKDIEAGHHDQQLETIWEAAEADQSQAKAGEQKAKATRDMSPQGSLNIRVAGYRRGNLTDAEIRKTFEDEGVDKEMIDIALDPTHPKRSKKGKAKAS